MTDTMIGRVFNDRYRITEQLGIGGMAMVYKATDTVLGRTVAVKVMLPQYAADPEFNQRFKQEAASAANLSNPYIVNVYDWGQDADTYYIVMEFVRGSDLKSGIKQRGAINQRKAAEIGIQVCAALQEAHHQDIIHRDIKPQNIMVQPDGNVKVMDFGIARAKNSVKNTTGSVLGTAHYISPEQAQGKELGATSDLYSLGIVLYECVTGRVPFDGPDAVSVALKQVKDQPIPPRTVNPNVDQGLQAIILRAMAKDPAQRYQSAAAMKDALQAYLAGAPISGYGEPIAADAAATVMMNPEAAASFAAGAAAGVAGGRMSSPDQTVMLGSGNPYDSGRYGTPGMGVSGRIGTGSVTDAQAAARARLAARNYQAGGGGHSTGRGNNSNSLSGPLGTVRTVSAYNKKYDGMKKSNLGIIIGFILVFAAAVVGLILFLGGGTGSGSETVPNVVGKSQAEATRAIKTCGYYVADPIEKEYSDEVDSGKVIRQSPEAGTELAAGGTVSIVVSKGKEMVTVPNISNKTVTEAQQMLEAKGLVPKAGLAIHSAEVEIGKVISQDPIAGTKIAKGSTVTYVLSLGTEDVGVPSVEGYDVASAKTLLEGVGFTVVEQHEYSNTIEKGKVISQSPASGSKLEKGGTVTVVVSDGKELVKVPPLVNKTMKEATEELLALGLSVNKVGATEDDAVVEKQSPNASTPDESTWVTKGTKVTITGKATKVPVPDVVGMTMFDAETTLAGEGFVVVKTGDTANDAIVISQSPVATVGDSPKVEPGTTVTITGRISQVTVPNVVGKTMAEAEAALVAAGFGVIRNGDIDNAATVIAQSPGGGASVNPGTTVTITGQTTGGGDEPGGDEPGGDEPGGDDPGEGGGEGGSGEGGGEGGA